MAGVTGMAGCVDRMVGWVDDHAGCLCRSRSTGVGRGARDIRKSPRESQALHHPPKLSLWAVWGPANPELRSGTVYAVIVSITIWRSYCLRPADHFIRNFGCAHCGCIPVHLNTHPLTQHQPIMH